MNVAIRLPLITEMGVLRKGGGLRGLRPRVVILGAGFAGWLRRGP